MKKRVGRRTFGLKAGLVAAALLAAACGSKDVVAEVGSRKIRRNDLVAPLGAPNATAAKKRLDEILPRAILAEGARRAGLDRNPEVAARIHAAEREILAQAYLDAETRSVAEDTSLRKFYEEKKSSLSRKQIHVRHIVVRKAAIKDAEAEHAAQQRISAIYAELVGGADFEKLARERSDDTVSGQKGGDLGPLIEGQVDSAFFTAAATLRRGETSKPFQTPLGFHVAQAVEDPATVVPSFEEARGRLAAQARGEAQAKLIERLRSEMTVRVYEDRLVSEQK